MNKSKKPLAMLSTAAIAGLIVAAVTTPVSAKTTALSVTGKDSNAYQYDFTALKASAVSAILNGATDPGAKLYEDFLTRKSTISAYYDDVKAAYIDASVVNAAAVNAITSGKPFVLDTFTSATSTPTIAVTPATVTTDANHNVIVTPTGLSVSSVSAINDITVANGTAVANLGLPTTVGVTLSDKSTKTANVTWDTSSYVATTAGTYALTGTITPATSDTYTVPAGTTAKVNVIVNAAVVPALQSASYIGGSSTVTLNFDQNLNTNSVPLASDFQLLDISSKGTSSKAVGLAPYVQVSGKSVILTTTTALSDPTYQISYTKGTNPIESANGNVVASSFVPTNVTVAATSGAINLKAVPAAGSTATITFNNPTTGTMPASYNVNASINGGPYTLVKNVTNAPGTTPYSVTYTGLEGQNVTFEVDALDSSSKVQSSTAATPSITLTSAAPTVTSATVNGTQLTLTLSKTIGTLTNANLNTLKSDFTIAGAAATPTVSSVAVNGNQVVLTLNSAVLSTDSSVTVAYNGTLITDTVGNALAQFTATSAKAVTNNTTGNTGTFVDQNAVNSSQLEEYQLNNSLGTQVSLASTNVISIKVTNPDGSIANVTPTSDGYLDFDVTSPAGTYNYNVVDKNGVSYTAALNWAGTQAGVAKYTDDTTSGVDAFDINNSSSATSPITITQAFVVNPDGTKTTLGAATTPALNSSVINFTYATATAGNYAVYAEDSTHAWHSATINMPSAVTAPTVSTATTTGSALTIGMSDTLATVASLTTSAFTVSVNGVNTTVSAAASSGKDVTLTLSPPVKSTDTVVVSYAVPTTGTAIVDGNGLNVSGFTNQAVTNNTLAPTFSTASVNTTALAITYTSSIGLSASSIPDASDYTVTVNGINDQVNSVSISGNVVTLTLAVAPATGTTVNVSYKPGTNPVKDTNGSPAAPISSQVVSVRSTT
jgi:uncharacterized repeat protein (TIGR02059 family)